MKKISILFLMLGLVNLKAFGEPNSDASSRYILDGSTVVDTVSGLRCQRCSIGQRWRPDNTCSGRPTPLDFAQTRRLAVYPPKNPDLGPDKFMWRVPTRNELRTLVDMQRAPLKIDTLMFPDINKNNTLYWTSDMEGGGGQVWFVDFRDGHVGSHRGDHVNETQKLNVRLVHLEANERFDDAYPNGTTP